MPVNFEYSNCMVHNETLMPLDVQSPEVEPFIVAIIGIDCTLCDEDEMEIIITPSTISPIDMVKSLPVDYIMYENCAIVLEPYWSNLREYRENGYILTFEDDHMNTINRLNRDTR